MTISAEERARHFEEQRQARMAAARGAGITEEVISELVERFYAAIQAHETLGPVFASHISDWPFHLANMKRFWASVLMGAGSYSGSPMVKHVRLPLVEKADFLAWLGLFKQTLTSLDLPEEIRAQILGRAHSIAGSLLNGIRMVRDGEKDPANLRNLPQV